MAAPMMTIFDDHLLLSALLEPIPQCLDCFVEPESRHRRKVHGSTQPSVADLRHLRIAPDGGARLMVTQHKACVGGCLTRALEPLRRSELAYHDRSGLEPNPRNRVQKRAAIFQLRILLDMFFDFLLQILDLAVNLFEEAAVRTANRLILGLIQPARAFGFSLSEGPAGLFDGLG